MKTKYTVKKSKPQVLNDALAIAPPEPMVRTQIYLSRREHEFVSHEAARHGQPMAAVIRSLIEEKMDVPDDVWTDNPLLDPPVNDPSWKGHDDGALNHDHYIYGTPKKWVGPKGKMVEAPPLPEDYYTNPAVRRAYDEKVNGRK